MIIVDMPSEDDISRAESIVESEPQVATQAAFNFGIDREELSLGNLPRAAAASDS